MDFSFSEDQELMIDSIKEFAATYFTDEAVKEMYEVHHGVPDEVQDAYRDLGFAFMGLPEEVGGIPATRIDLGILTETLYRATGCMTPFMTAMLMTLQNSVLKSSASSSSIITRRRATASLQCAFLSLVLVPTTWA